MSTSVLGAASFPAAGSTGSLLPRPCRDGAGCAACLLGCHDVAFLCPALTVAAPLATNHRRRSPAGEPQRLAARFRRMPVPPTLIRRKTRKACGAQRIRGEKVDARHGAGQGDEGQRSGRHAHDELLKRWASTTKSWSTPASCWPARGCTRSSKGKRVRFGGRSARSSTGRSPRPSELVAGFWLWQVKIMDEAVEWVERCPNPMPGPSEIEIRPVFEADDFGDALTPEIAEREDRVCAKAVGPRSGGI